MKKTKLTRYEKLDKKYGSPTFSRMASKNESARKYYEMFLESEKQRNFETISATIGYILTFIFLLFSFLDRTFLIPMITFLILATHSILDARIEAIWSMRWLDKTFDAIKKYCLKNEGVK